MRSDLVTLLTIGSLLIFSAARSQGSDSLNITSYNLKLNIPFLHKGMDASENTLTGTATISFVNSSSKPVRHISLLLHRLLVVSSLRDEQGKLLPFKQQIGSIAEWETFQVNTIITELKNELKPGDSFTLEVSYHGYMTGYEESGMLYVKESLDPAFTIIRPESFSYPQLAELSRRSLESRWGSEIVFDQRIEITLPETHTAASGYKLLSKQVNEGHITWIYQSEKSSESIIIPVAPYKVLPGEICQIFYFPEDEDGAKRIADGVKKVMSLYEEMMGKLKAPANFALAEMPDNYGSQALMPTIIQTAASFKAQRSMGELYHEISHLWNVKDNDAKPPRWNEGQAMFLQYVAYEKLNEEGSMIPSLEKRLQLLKKRFNTNPELKEISMEDFGTRDVTSLSYSAGPLFFYLLSETMGLDNLLEAFGAFYREKFAGGTTAKEFAEFIIGRDKNTKPVFDDWFFGSRYTSLILKAENTGELVRVYKK